MTIVKTIQPRRATHRPKVSHRLSLRRVAATEKKEGLSDGVWALRIIVLYGINLAHKILYVIE
jgi:hypothetical protein